MVEETQNLAATSNEPKAKRKRRRKKKNNSVSKDKPTQNPPPKSKSKKKKKNKPQQPTIHLPHAKVTIRNISNVEKYGSLQGMIDLVKELVQDRNANKHSLLSEEGNKIAKVVSPLDLVLDEVSIRRFLEREKLKMEKMKQEEEQDEGDEAKDVDEDMAGQETQAENVDYEQNEGDKNDGPDAVNNEEVAEKSVVSDPKDDPNSIFARILYIVPPKKSRRRGVLPGHCYLALYPPMPSFIQEKMKVIEEEKKEAEKQSKELEIVTEALQDMTIQNDVEGSDEASTILKNVESSITNDDTTTEKNEDSNSHNADSELKVAVTEPITQTKITASDKTRALAQTRLLLNETVATLTKLCKDDSSNGKSYKDLDVFMSPNQKIWKNEEGRKFGFSAKYDSTLEQSEDFRKFLEKKKNMQEDLSSRAKPPPGGIPISDLLSTGLGEEKVSSRIDGPVSAIVAHLLEKKEAARLAKKKAAAEKKKKKAKSKQSTTKKEEEKKKKTKRKKKNSSKTGDAKVAPVPKMLLKK